MSRRVVVVGHGMVGARFVEEVRRRDPNGSRLRLTVLGAEPRPAYNRVLLSTVLAGGLNQDSVNLHPPGWALRHRIDLRTGVAATAIDRGRRLVHTDSGEAEHYDELVLATGSSPNLPQLPGVEGGLADGGVVAFRDMDDCARIVRLARPGARFAVLGGGLLGCEAARGLAGRGVRVSLVHPKSALMERQLDEGGSAVLATALGRLGIEVRLGSRASAWEPGAGLRLTASDELIAADVLVLATGVRPATDLADAAELEVRRGIVVDDRLTSSDPRVHAIGDCATHHGAPSGLVQPGWEQARVLADLLTGADMSASYTGTRAVTRLKAKGIDLATVGDPASLATGEVLRFSDPVGGRYAALALHEDRVVGGAMIGLPDAAANMIQFYDTGMAAPTDRLSLLFGRALPVAATPTADPGHLPAAAVVCRCNTVTKGALVAAWRDGATDVGALSRATRAGTGCGSCAQTVSGICAWLNEADPPAGSPVGAVQEGAA